MKDKQALFCLQVPTTILRAVKAYCQGVQPAADGNHGQPLRYTRLDHTPTR
jgi:hypothetical protein